ncbi:MAG: polysaccharide pyruvyl transferase family protein [Candidatus Omnitrophota bacterium]
MAIIFKKIIYSVMAVFLYLKIKKYKQTKKIIYAITPTPNLKNIGDHSQVVCIKRWFSDCFKEYLVLEFDKNEVINFISAIKKVVNADDLIFLHSGGNLGDRGMWSERARRLVIQNFPNNRIISLPQTIYFSNTDTGKKERENTKKIYNLHNNLTIIARDYGSFELAKQMFYNNKVLVCPDFVLYHKIKEFPNREDSLLMCFRNDDESIMDLKKKEVIKGNLTKLNMRFDEFDTTIKQPISRSGRQALLENTLDFFGKHRLVLTDRFHGVIFSVLTKTPCIIFPTVDHKLKEGAKWFEEFNYIFYINNLENLPNLINSTLKIDKPNNFNWDEAYFNKFFEVL